MKGFIKVRVASDGSDDREINPAHIVYVQAVEGTALHRIYLSNGVVVNGTILDDPTGPV
ncbi:MAG: hypothetical protein WC729_29955 [Sphingomonas sp.]|jgi:hypothetical protein|uniref:hypothetical protein n=1 Tax=Sphingomonas sp. TaxID=28214 RepID=UPI00356901BE